MDKPLVIKCRLTIPNEVDLSDIYFKFANSKFTVIKKSDLYPNRDGQAGSFYLDLYIWESNYKVLPTKEDKGKAEVPAPVRSIRIKRHADGEWQQVKLLAQCAGWAQVDDGQGPLWVMLDHVHPADIRLIFGEAG